MSDKAEKAAYHRTFEKFSMGMWPIWKKNPNGFHYRGQAYHRQEQEDAHAERVNAFYAHQRVGKQFSKVRVMPKKDQDFDAYATAWEDFHSELTSIFSARVEPVVDDDFTVVGHIGWFYASEMFIPKNQSPTAFPQRLLEQGVAIYADGRSNTPSYLHSLYVGKPEWKYQVYTGPDGEVLGILSYDTGNGAISTMPPWEMFGIGKAAIVLARTGVSQVVKVASRIRSAKTVANGPTRTASERTPPPPPPPPAGAGAPLVVKGSKVTRAEMLAWEKHGGHTLQNHGPQMTQANLKSRITGREQIQAPNIQPGGYKPPDMRVWQGDKSLAASKFAGEEEMHKAIGKVLDENIEHIRRVTGNGGQVTLLNQSVGFKTGSGYVSAATKEAQKKASGVFYDDNLTGVTVIIRRRPDWMRTAKDPEGWYVHTAFPDRAIK